MALQKSNCAHFTAIWSRHISSFSCMDTIGQIREQKISISYTLTSTSWCKNLMFHECQEDCRSCGFIQINFILRDLLKELYSYMATAGWIGMVAVHAVSMHIGKTFHQLLYPLPTLAVNWEWFCIRPKERDCISNGRRNNLVYICAWISESIFIVWFPPTWLWYTKFSQLLYTTMYHLLCLFIDCFIYVFGYSVWWIGMAIVSIHIKNDIMFSFNMFALACTLNILLWVLVLIRFVSVYM